MLQVDGRAFLPETIYFKDQSFSGGPSAEWSNHTKTPKVIEAISLFKWVLVTTSNLKVLAQVFTNNLKKVGAPLGIGISEPHFVLIPDDRSTTYVQYVKKELERDKALQCAVFLLPNTRKDRYDAIKQLCLLELPIPSQCVVQKSLNKANTFLSVCHKISQQINCKVGGQLWRVDIPLQKTMIIGIDVCHDTTPGGRQSVVGFCATMNNYFTKYYSRAIFQSRTQEIVDGLKSCFQDALRAFFQVNGCLPERVFVYRDGVGDGMLDAVVCLFVYLHSFSFSFFFFKFN